jgi:hypothetical protein
MDKTEQLDWARTTYLAHLASLIDSNMTYLHSTLTWAVTILLGGLGFVVTRSSFPDHVSFVSVLVLIVVLGHFAVRTAKAYLNIVRFGALEKHVLLSYLHDKPETWWQIRSRIIQYHCDWSSPLEFKSVAYKLLLELGFLYFFGIAIGLAIYILFAVGPTCYMMAGFVGALLLLALEIRVGLLRSPYFRSVRPDEIAQAQR